MPAGRPGTSHMPPEGVTMQTHRLDPSQPPMVAATQWLLDRARDGSLDLSGTLLVTPGSRAGRVLVTLLAQACADRSWVLAPPQTATAGRLVEALAPADSPASDLHRALAWKATLADAPADLVARVLPDSGQATQWAEEIASAADELARGGYRFGEVATASLPPLEPPERWEALGALQRRYEAVLEGAGLTDPSLHALDASSAGGGLDAIVLLACTDLPNVARRLLRRASCPVFVLQTLEAGLHEDGVVDDGFWRDADLEVDPKHIFVTGGPDEQAMLAVRAAIDLNTSAIGTADEALSGDLRRAADACGLTVHVASGTPVLASGPARLLGDIELLLREPSFAAMSRILRNPAVVAGLSTVHPEYAKLPRALDEYVASAVPTRAFDRLPFGDDRAALPRKLVRKARRRVIDTISPLRERPKPLRGWAEPVSGALAALLAPAQESLGEASMAALDTIGQQLRALASLPESLDAKAVPAHEAISIVLGQLARASAAVEPGSEELDLLGWLELPLDPSPALVVMGAHDATLPAARAPGPLLTEGLLRALGLPGEDRAMARDAANMATLLASGRNVRFVLGTSNAVGDPLLPSTLLLRGRGDHPARVLGRVREAFETAPASQAPPRCSFRVGVMAPATPIERMAVTSFRSYLESPYLFFLRHALRLREVEPSGPIPRLEANAFGTILHESLRVFAGQVEHRDETDEQRLRQLMHAALWVTVDRFAGSARSAIMMAQIDAAERRLAHLAQLEAQRRAAGWRTIAVEWRPREPMPLGDTGVALTGSIDRIDWREEDNALALLDYKTGEQVRPPTATHRSRDGSWTDLQLPLYELLAMPIAAERGIEAPPSLGYIALTRTSAKWLDSAWDEDDRHDAVRCASEIARTVRRGAEAMRDLGRPGYDSALSRLAGVGLLLDPEHDLLRHGGLP